ncbi:Steroidogenic acute regulatory protein, mitochondrial, partial [Megadyptes antipodes antipodes]
SCAMLRATVKLCCGIAHDHLRRLPGKHCSPPRRPWEKQAEKRVLKEMLSLHLMGIPLGGGFTLLCLAPAAACLEPAGDVSPSQFSSVDLFYITQGETALQRALSILQQHTSWQAETMLDAVAAVSSAALPGLGKVFRAEVVLAVPVARLHRELFEGIEQMPQWNPTLSQVKVLQRIGMDTLVTHEVTAPSPGNLVGQRDFVSVQHRGRRETAIYLVGTATHVEPLPLQEGCIRAESRLSCIVLQPLAGDPGRTRFTWLLSMDLKASAAMLFGGWIPTSIINRVLPQSQADFIKHLCRHLSATACP